MPRSKNIMAYPDHLLAALEYVLQTGRAMEFTEETPGRARSWQTRWYSFIASVRLAYVPSNFARLPEPMQVRMRKLEDHYGQVGCWTEGNKVKLMNKGFTSDAIKIRALIAAGVDAPTPLDAEATESAARMLRMMNAQAPVQEVAAQVSTHLTHVGRVGPRPVVDDDPTKPTLKVNDGPERPPAGWFPPDGAPNKYY